MIWGYPYFRKPPYNPHSSTLTREAVVLIFGHHLGPWSGKKWGLQLDIPVVGMDIYIYIEPLKQSITWIYGGVLNYGYSKNNSDWEFP